MATEECKSTSSNELFNKQINELKQMKIDLEKQKNELTNAQSKYHHLLSGYEVKLEQLHLQTKKIQQEQDEKETNLANATAEWLDIKKKLESSAVSPSQKVKLNVGGGFFETTIETLTRYSEGSNSYFKALFSRQWQLEKDPKDDSIFIDRDTELFGFILQYLRTGKLQLDFMDNLIRQDLIIEAQFYNLDSLVSLLNMSQSKKENRPQVNPQVDTKILYLETMILSCSNQKDLNKLSGYDNQQWQLIYRASHDGYTGNAFHKFCDGRSPTMTVIRSKNKCIFGGFTSIPWSSINENKADSFAFLFTLENPHGIKPTKYPIRERAVKFAVGHKSANGPTFGSVDNGGSDIFLRSPFTGEPSRIFFPNSYTDTTGKGRTTFTGDSHFVAEEVEVFLPLPN